MNPFRTIFASLLALAALAAAVPAFAPAAVVTRDVAKSPAAIRDYWTQARMRAAEPAAVEPATPPAPAPGPAEGDGAPTYVAPAAPGSDAGATIERGTATPGRASSRRSSPVLDATAAGVRTHGKVFFTVKGGTDPGNFVCSGTAVHSRNKSLVWTAGHCVYDAETRGGKSVNFEFVPAYRAGAEPYGEWPAVELATTRRWKRDANLRYDMGAVVVARNSAGRTLQSVVGGRGIGFDQPRRQNYEVFGYPAELPFTGELEYLCESPNRGADVPGGGTGPKTLRVGCDMTGGASGGGWIANGILLSNTSYGYGTSPYLYGPYFSQTAKKLYKRVRR